MNNPVKCLYRPPVAERPTFVHACSQPLPAVPNVAPTYDTVSGMRV